MARYQQGPLTHLPLDQEVESLKDLDQNIQGIIVNWPGDAYTPLKKHKDVLKLINCAKKNGKHVIIELEPSISNLWFEKSEKKDPDYENYYIWRAGTFKVGDSILSPPNNWVSQSNTSSWKYSEAREEFYYSPFIKPHLNFRNKLVIQEFSRVIESFLAANVSGIRLRNAAFLLVDSNFENEDLDSNAQTGLGHTQYGFFKNSKTENLPELSLLLKEWKNVIKKKTGDGPLMIAEELGNIDSYKHEEILVVDAPLQNRVFSKPSLSVNEIANTLNQIFHVDNIEWPLWEAKTNAVPLDVLHIMTYLLPGTPLVNVSEGVNSAILKIRESPSVMRGICGVYTLQNNTVLAFIRVTPGSPGILVAVNPTDDTSTVNLKAEIPPLADLQEVTIRHYSSNYNETSFTDIGCKKEATAIPVTAKSALVLEYVPKREE